MASARRSRAATSTNCWHKSLAGPDGTYRVVAGRLIPGKIIGNFRYQGTRPDDPNDLVPHQHRRELRGLFVFGAWTNLTDFKSNNTLDTLVTGERTHRRQALPSRRWLDIRHDQRAASVGERLGVFPRTRHYRRSDCSRSDLRRAHGEPSNTPKRRRLGSSRAIASIRGRGRRTRPTPPQSKCATTMRSGPRSASPPSVLT